MISDNERNWQKVWSDDEGYGDCFYMRAKGEYPEMESSKALAKLVDGYMKNGDKVLDVGCGAGHYYTSIRKRIDKTFTYKGIDATPYYIEKGKEVFAKDKNVSLQVGDIFNLSLTNQSSDLTICCNVLLHLPSIKKPIEELWRVTDRCLIIRALVGDVSFRIKQINSPEEYDEAGDPVNYHYFNIYSRAYVEQLASQLAGVKKVQIIRDVDYNPSQLGEAVQANYQNPRAMDLTKVLNGLQVNNYIILPWSFVIIEKS